MTNAQVRKSIETGRLHLSPIHTFNHFAISCSLAGIGLLWVALSLWDYLRGEYLSPFAAIYDVFPFSLLFFCLAILLFVFQRRYLRIQAIETDMTIDDLRQQLSAAATKFGWTTRNNRKTFMIFQTHPGFTWNWGERITVLFDKDSVWLNSICDPNEWSFYSSGRNKTNVEKLIGFVAGTNRIGN